MGYDDERLAIAVAQVEEEFVQFLFILGVEAARRFVGKHHIGVVDEGAGNSWWNWNTKPMCLLRKAARRLLLKRPKSSPLKRIIPPVGLSSVPMSCRRVVLPAPLEPTMLITSPLLIVRLTPFST